MPKRIHKVVLDSNKSTPLFEINKLDSLHLEVEVTEVETLENAEVELFFKKSDGTLVSEIISEKEQNILKIDVKNGALDVPGIVVGQAKITEEDGNISSHMFKFNIKNSITSDDAIVNEIGIGAIEELKEKINNAQIDPEVLKNKIEETINNGDLDVVSKEELKQVNSQLEEKANKENVVSLEENANINIAPESPNTMTIKDTDIYLSKGNEVLEDWLQLEIGGVNSYKNLQARNMASFMQKLPSRGELKIVCQGDSMTYGYDIYSTDKRTYDQDPTRGDGNNDQTTISAKTYPERLQELFDEYYENGKATVINRGRSGHYAKTSYELWNTNPNANLHILMLGTNDAGTNPPENIAGNIKVYIDYMSKIIERILRWNSAIVLCTPPRHNDDNNANRKAYRTAVYCLGEKYGIPVINVCDEMKQYSSAQIQAYDENTSTILDTVHYSAKGYSILASIIYRHITTPINFYNKNIVKSNVFINPNAVDLSTYTSNTSGVSYLSFGGGMASGQIKNEEGVLWQCNPGGKLTIVFYAEEDGLCLYPFYKCNKGAGKFTLNYGLELPKANSFIMGVKSQAEVTPYGNSLTKADGTSLIGTSAVSKVYSKSDIDTDCLFIPTRGWYSITIENTSKTGQVYFYGANVVNIRSLN